MCLPSFDPVSLGLNTAMIAGGAGLGAAGQAKTRNEQILNNARMAEARNAVLRDYTGTQGGLQDENTRTVNDTVGRFSAPAQATVLNDAQGTRAAHADEALAPLLDPSYADIPLAGDTPAGVKQDLADRMLAGFRKATSTAQARAKLGGYGDQWGDNAITTSEGGRKIDTVNQFVKQNTALLPQLQEFAQYGAYEPPSGTGVALSTLGNIFAGIGGSGIGGAFKPAGAAAGAARFGPTAYMADAGMGM